MCSVDGDFRDCDVKLQIDALDFNSPLKDRQASSRRSVRGGQSERAALVSTLFNGSPQSGSRREGKFEVALIRHFSGQTLCRERQQNTASPVNWIILRY
jgi:hypothetical protein